MPQNVWPKWTRNTLCKKKWLDILPPYQGGGGMINEVKKSGITYAEGPTKFEAGTGQTAEVVSFL